MPNTDVIGVSTITKELVLALLQERKDKVQKMKENCMHSILGTVAAKAQDDTLYKAMKEIRDLPIKD